MDQDAAAGRSGRGRRDSSRRSGGRPGSASPFSCALQPRVPERARRLRLHLLREAAALTTQPTLKAFLESRADAFFSNDYYDSDVAWMELDAASSRPSAPTRSTRTNGSTTRPPSRRSSPSRRGRDRQAAEVRRRAAGHREQPADRPEATATRSSARGAHPRRQRVFASGDANRGVQTAAFNLPNDERVIREKGAKRVMLKNSQEAKFAKMLHADRQGRARAGGSERTSRSTRSSPTS